MSRVSPNVLAVFCVCTMTFATQALEPDTKASIEQLLTAPHSASSIRLVFDDATPAAPLDLRDIKRVFSATDAVEFPQPAIALPGNGKLDIVLCAAWSAREDALRLWLRFRAMDTPAAKVLNEIVVLDLDVSGKDVRVFPGAIQSYPVFLPGIFAGIEFPTAATRVEKDHLLLAHRPGLHIEPGMWHESRKAVLGYSWPGQELAAFRRYISSHRPAPTGLHINYNSWWTSPAPYYTENDIVGLMETFQKYFYEPTGVSFDTFCIDMGWSNPKSIWEIDQKLFPEGFSRIQAAAKDMKSRLGLWISPSSRYPTALDNAWAKENGYEELKDALCLGGGRYAAAFRDRLVEMVTRYDIRHIKLDGYVFECPETDHGHAPGAQSADAIAQGFISVAEAVHGAAPDTWVETTCMGNNPSPWWLFHFNSVIGSFGDDAPYGRVPAPVYRESYTTARDYWNLQGAWWSPVPPDGQEVLGIIHQTADPFTNDAVMTLMRGHMFLPLYVNPKYMDENRWRSLAQLLGWARRNAGYLASTDPLLPVSWCDGKCPQFTADASMPREPYGYAHWAREHGFIALRNPWIQPQHYQLRMNTPGFGVNGFGAPTPATDTKVSIMSIYPEPRVYARDVPALDAIDIPLAPYETLVLDVALVPPRDDIPVAADTIGNCIKTHKPKIVCKRVEFEGPKETFGPDWTSLVGDAGRQTRVTITSHVKVNAPQSAVLVLLEAGDKSPAAQVQCRVDGRDAEVTENVSDAGWAATGQPRPEHWTFYSAPLGDAGSHDVDVEISSSESGVKASVWVWAKKTGQVTAPTEPITLPEPEIISLDAKPLLESVDLSSVSAEIVHEPRPVEKINGIFLDAVEPVSVSQGYGTLQKNRSVWEKPMTIKGVPYRRGLGTHAPSKIVYNLDGQYKRFQADAGADGATAPTITFEVWVDGQKRWESGLMTRDDPAKPVDIDITGAKTLELIAGDGGNGLNADHANWANARLLR